MTKHYASYYAGNDRKAEGLKETLDNKVPKKKNEMLNYAALWIRAGALLHTLTHRTT